MEAAIQKALSDLIATCRDSEEGFGKAAKGVQRDDMREMLTQTSRERADFSDEIEGMLRRMGAEASGHTHAGGILHRGWIDLEARIRPKDDSELVENCERGEETTLKHSSTMSTLWHSLCRMRPGGLWINRPKPSGTHSSASVQWRRCQAWQGRRDFSPAVPDAD